MSSDSDICYSLESMNSKYSSNDPLQQLSIIQLRQMKELYKFYEILEKLGVGTFGTVYKAEEYRTKETRALKIGNKLEDVHKNKFYQEIKILQMINHKNIVRLYKVFESKHKICLVLEYCPRDLSQIFNEKKKLLEEDVRSIIKYLSCTIAYLHGKGIVHRDLKLENILLSSNPENPLDPWFIKLIDFGLSAIRKGIGFDSMFNTFCGTLHYIAPELATKSYSQKCDIWSLGVIMFLLLEGRFPFNIADIEHAVETIQSTHIDFSSLNCSKEAADLISMCLKKNPALRISAGEILLHPFISAIKCTGSVVKSCNVIEMMDEYNSRSSTESSGVPQLIQQRLPSANSLTFQNFLVSNVPDEILGSAESMLPSDVNEPKILVTGSINRSMS